MMENSTNSENQFLIVGLFLLALAVIGLNLFIYFLR